MSQTTVTVSPSKPVTQPREALNMKWFKDIIMFFKALNMKWIKGIIMFFAVAIALTGLGYGVSLAYNWRTARDATTLSIVCYSNNTKIYDGETTRGSLIINGGLWSFQDATGHKMNISGNCVAREQ